MSRFVVKVDKSQDSNPIWMVIDTLSSDVVKKYSNSDAEIRALEVAECKNWDEDQSIFAQFG